MDDQHRRPQGARPPPRHGRRARAGSLGAVRREGRDSRGHPRGRRDAGVDCSGGSRAYSTNTLESGWIPSPLPAVYTGEKMKSYREWLPATGYEATGSIGGSFVSNDIERLLHLALRARLRPLRQVRPRLHRPRGAREDARQAASQEGDLRLERRRHGEDRLLFRPAIENYKFYDLPNANYASSRYDKVKRDGKAVGVSMFGGYSFNERTAFRSAWSIRTSRSAMS